MSSIFLYLVDKITAHKAEYEILFPPDEIAAFLKYVDLKKTNLHKKIPFRKQVREGGVKTYHYQPLNLGIS